MEPLLPAQQVPADRRARVWGCPQGPSSAGLATAPAPALRSEGAFSGWRGPLALSARGKDRRTGACPVTPTSAIPSAYSPGLGQGVGSRAQRPCPAARGCTSHSHQLLEGQPHAALLWNPPAELGMVYATRTVGIMTCYQPGVSVLREQVTGKSPDQEALGSPRG